MSVLLHGYRQVPGGYQVDLEVQNAYGNGASRIDTVFLTNVEIAGLTPAQLKALLASRYQTDPYAQFIGAVIIP